MIKSYKKQFTLITEVKRKHKKKMKLIQKFGYWYLKNKSYFFCFKLKKRMQYKRILDLMLQYLYTHKRRTYLFSKTLANRSFMHNFQNLQTRLDIMLIRVYCCWTIKEALFLIQKAVVCINDIRQTKIQSCFILDKITIKAWFFFTKRKFLPIYNWGVSNYVKGEKSKKQQKRKWIWDYRGFFNMRFGKARAFLYSKWKWKNHIIVQPLHPQESLTINYRHRDYGGKKTAYISRSLKSLWLIY